MATLKSEVERLVQTLVADHGCQAKISKNGHWRISRRGHSAITMARTPSDRRAVDNMRTDIRRYLGVSL